MTKQTLLLLHGALGTLHQFDELATVLSAHYTVHTMNFAGHGGRDAASDFSIELFTENVVGFLREKGIVSTAVFGYSMGGYVGVNVAKKHPSLVAKIVTLGTKFNWSRAAAEKETKMLNPDIIAQKVPHFAAALEAKHAPNDWKELLHKTAAMMLGIADRERLTDEDLSAIQQNVLIGIGSEDRMVSIEESTQAAHALAEGELKIITGFHHPIEKNDVQQLATIIDDFIK